MKKLPIFFVGGLFIFLGLFYYFLYFSGACESSLGEKRFYFDNKRSVLVDNHLHREYFLVNEGKAIRYPDLVETCEALNYERLKVERPWRIPSIVELLSLFEANVATMTKKEFDKNFDSLSPYQHYSRVQLGELFREKYSKAKFVNIMKMMSLKASSHDLQKASIWSSSLTSNQEHYKEVDIFIRAGIRDSIPYPHYCLINGDTVGNISVTSGPLMGILVREQLGNYPLP